MEESCKEIIISEAYIDFIWPSDLSAEKLKEQYPNVCIEKLNSYYITFFAEIAYLRRYAQQYGYEIFPALYTLLETESLEVSNILQLQNQPVLQLKGSGVIVGLIDTGERVIIMSS